MPKVITAELFRRGFSDTIRCAAAAPGYVGTEMVDAVAALLLMSREKADSLGLPIRAVIRGFDFGGIDPAYMGLGPIPATRKLLKKLGMSLSDIEYFVLNEAFASQPLASLCIGGGQGVAMVVERPIL